ncbi:hypothetical protein Tco_0612336 [Tanacetum coccineum]
MSVLEINNCGDGVLTSLIHVASAVTKLSICRISGLSDEVWRSVMDYLGEVEEVKASKVLVNLRKLELLEKELLNPSMPAMLEVVRV